MLVFSNSAILPFTKNSLCAARAQSQQTTLMLNKLLQKQTTLSKQFKIKPRPITPAWHKPTHIIQSQKQHQEQLKKNLQVQMRFSTPSLPTISKQTQNVRESYEKMKLSHNKYELHQPAQILKQHVTPPLHITELEFKNENKEYLKQTLAELHQNEESQNKSKTSSSNQIDNDESKSKNQQIEANQYNNESKNTLTSKNQYQEQSQMLLKQKQIAQYTLDSEFALQRIQKEKCPKNHTAHSYSALLSTLPRQDQQESIKLLQNLLETSSPEAKRNIQLVLEFEKLKPVDDEEFRVQQEKIRGQIQIFVVNEKTAQDYVQDLIAESSAYVDKIVEESQEYISKMDLEKITALEQHIGVENNVQEVLGKVQSIKEAEELVKELQNARRVFEGIVGK
ncbi:Hypothetical_protein [Hexamita inflata]|uniref:Hypothetical_protein n=1 Tax=Hexamita inflata TaxID=28002 RepID=A0AA86VIR8_9EUKA|nr:Hypothetical protein HINF_LOCUS55503 [Hexamita inflata]